MGSWAKGLFGKEKFSRVGLVLAGTANPKIEKTVLGFFDKTLHSRDSVYHGHLAKKGRQEYPVVFNVYGAPAMVDVMTEMYDGGCRTLLFVGYAYGGFRNLNVGTIVVPNRSYHFDGIYHPLHVDKEFSAPDKQLTKKVQTLFDRNEIHYVVGNNISVPAVTLQPCHYNKDYLKINPVTVEMELAACLSRAQEIGMRAAGVLIVSDNRTTSIADEVKKDFRYAAKIRVVKTLIDNLQTFDLPVKRTQLFSVEQHLARIIEDPRDMRNVYRK